MRMLEIPGNRYKQYLKTMNELGKYPPFKFMYDYAYQYKIKCKITGVTVTV